MTSDNWVNTIDLLIPNRNLLLSKLSKANVHINLDRKIYPEHPLVLLLFPNHPQLDNDLKNADLGENLTGKDLTRKNLTRKDLTRKDLTGKDLTSSGGQHDNGNNVNKVEKADDNNDKTGSQRYQGPSLGVCNSVMANTYNGKGS